MKENRVRSYSVRFLPALLLCGACISPGKAPRLRFFSPDMGTPEGSAGREPARLDGRVRLRRLNSAAHLRDRIVWRKGVELGFVEGSRWTETPIVYVERALAHSLFEEAGLERSESSLDPFVDIELSAFEWVLDKPEHVRIALTLRLGRRSGGVSLLETTMSQEWELPQGAEAGDVAQAMGRSLQELVTKVSSLVIDNLPREVSAVPQLPSED